MDQLLAGIRVLDFGRYIAAPWCAAMLGDLGADVIRVERREGGEDRWMTPLSDTGAGAMFMQCNRNKRSITLDPQTVEGAAIRDRLVASADVVVANLPDDTLAALGLDYDSLRAIKPDIILANGTAYGSGGPYSDRIGYDGIGQVMSGAIYRSGTPDAPMRAAVPYVDYGTAIALAAGVLAALLHRQQTGEGQKVEGSLLGTALLMSSSLLIEQGVLQNDRVAIGNRAYNAAPSDLYLTRDGRVLVQIVGQAQFKRWCRLIGEEALFTDPRFADDEQRGVNGDILNDRMAAWCNERTNAEVLAALEAVRIPASAMYSPQQALDDEHVRAMRYCTPVDYPGLPRPAPVADTPFRLSRTPATIRERPPLIGEHTADVLQSLGYDAATIEALRERRAI